MECPSDREKLNTFAHGHGHFCVVFCGTGIIKVKGDGASLGNTSGDSGQGEKLNDVNDVDEGLETRTHPTSFAGRSRSCRVISGDLA